MKPMLATSIPFNTIGPFLSDDTVVAQQKVDGDRVMIVVEDGKVSVLNRQGNPRSNPIPRNLVQQFAGLPGSWCFDGELLDELWLFDLPRAGDVVGPSHPYEFRHAVLERFFVSWQPNSLVRLLPSARTSWAKARLVEQVMSQGGEGVVFKKLDAPYLWGKRSRQMLKAKDTKTADCVVTEVARDGKNNCVVSLFDGGRLVEVGSCAMLGKPAVAVGDVVEVKYLYVDTGRRLVQAAFLRVRDDKAASECTVEQLAFTDRTVITSGGFIVVPSKSRKAPGVGLGRSQVLVLHLLAREGKSVRALSGGGCGLSAGAVRGALERLGRRGLVDRAFSAHDPEYFLTGEGREVEAQLLNTNEIMEASAS